VNMAALALVAVGWLFRNWDSLRPETLAIVLEFAAIAIMSVGGWLGGTLVYRNQIGVDHRYADAGKWREVTVEGQPGESVPIEGANELENDQMMLVHAAGRRIVLARTANGFTAFDDRCTHRGASLADGALVCGVVSCPWHGSQFSAHDGSLKAGPAEKPIETYVVDDSQGTVRIVLPT
jgi:nitrite reductase/ring-hydroxylating ferredoxin subunit